MQAFHQNRKQLMTNILTTSILKSKARDQPIQIQASKKLFCHVIVKNYLCNVLLKVLIKIESTRRREIKEQTPQLTLLYCGRTVRSSHWRSSVKKTVLKNFEISTGNTCVGVSFSKSCNYIKKRSRHRCFPVNIAKFLRLPIFKNICEKGCFLTVSMVHCYIALLVQGLDCMAALGFRVRVTGLNFCF